MNITIYTKNGCPNCVSAKMVLQMNGMAFEERSIERAEHREEFFSKFPEVRGMPQIFINEQRVGGLLGLQEALKQLKGC